MADGEPINFSQATPKHLNGEIIDEAQYVFAASNYEVQNYKFCNL
ncbi:hypothetical protein OGM63_16125 [Plectonema radiosum NIES-515]|uniref:Uncharacterized protein n=1 Tax=Plectonema radiosum NIES-515 TaxID=2986073 RepID=A0ABT3B0Y3_9CYAN|nr:hypothetical protein [Plectonema radiosum]MCV3215022.1 hypothetical protein [Plectonema radiosum NIES-515]